MPRSLARLVIGQTSGALIRRSNEAGECTLGDLLANAVQAGTANWGQNVASLIGRTELHADLVRRVSSTGLADITFGDACAAVPLSQSTITVSLTGADLEAALDQQFTLAGRAWIQVSSTLRYGWTAGAGSRPALVPGSVTIGGTPVDPAKTYLLTVGNGLRQGPSAIPVLAAAAPITAGRYGQGGASGGQQLDLLAAYLSTRIPVAVPPLDRITRIAA